MRERKLSRSRIEPIRDVLAIQDGWFMAEELFVLSLFCLRGSKALWEASYDVHSLMMNVRAALPYGE